MHGQLVKFDSNGSKTEFSCHEGKEHGKWAIHALQFEAFGEPTHFNFHEGALVTASNRVIGARKKEHMKNAMHGKLGL